MNVPKFKVAIEKGEIINKGGYHQPNNYSPFQKSCGCSLTTEKGAYRDTSVDLGDMVVHYYHQTPVVAKKDNKIWLNNGGYYTSTTKERINRYSPFKVYQRDYEWYVSVNDETLEFKNGMELEV